MININDFGIDLRNFLRFKTSFYICFVLFLFIFNKNYFNLFFLIFNFFNIYIYIIKLFS